MNKVLVDRELLELLRNFTFLHDDGCAGALRGCIDRSLAAQPAEAEGAVTKIECTTCRGTGNLEFEGGAVVKDCAPCKGTGRDLKAERYALAARLSEAIAALSAVTAERDGLLADRDDCLEARQYYADKCREVTAERDRIRAYVEAMRVDALPDGFVAVPTEPTEEMLTAYSTNPAHVASACAIYRAMISARPDAYAALAAKEE